MDFLSNTRYRMPVSFGPMPGPRQRVGGGRYGNTMARVESVATHFLTDFDQLTQLLPPGMVLEGEPVVTVEILYLSELGWLAGRGYTSLGIKMPVICKGKTETVRGPFLAVLWENRADPIITGREELGYSKLFCDIDPPAILGNRRRFVASWEGHRFFEMELSDITPASPQSERSDNGTIHYRYVPRIGAPGEADFAGPTLSPKGARTELIDYSRAAGSVRFIESRWEDLPTLVHIVNSLAALPVLEDRGATITNFRIDAEFANQRIVV